MLAQYDPQRPLPCFPSQSLRGLGLVAPDAFGGAIDHVYTRGAHQQPAPYSSPPFAPPSGALLSQTVESWDLNDADRAATSRLGPMTDSRVFLALEAASTSSAKQDGSPALPSVSAALCRMSLPSQRLEVWNRPTGSPGLTVPASESPLGSTSWDAARVAVEVQLASQSAFEPAEIAELRRALAAARGESMAWQRALDEERRKEAETFGQMLQLQERLGRQKVWHKAEAERGAAASLGLDVGEALTCRRAALVGDGRAPACVDSAVRASSAGSPQEMGRAAALMAAAVRISDAGSSAARSAPACATEGLPHRPVCVDSDAPIPAVAHSSSPYAHWAAASDPGRGATHYGADPGRWSFTATPLASATQSGLPSPDLLPRSHPRSPSRAALAHGQRTAIRPIACNCPSSHSASYRKRRQLADVEVPPSPDGPRSPPINDSTNIGAINGSTNTAASAVPCDLQSPAIGFPMTPEVTRLAGHPARAGARSLSHGFAAPPQLAWGSPCASGTGDACGAPSGSSSRSGAVRAADSPKAPANAGSDIRRTWCEGGTVDNGLADSELALLRRRVLELERSLEASQLAEAVATSEARRLRSAFAEASAKLAAAQEVAEEKGRQLASALRAKGRAELAVAKAKGKAVGSKARSAEGVQRVDVASNGPSTSSDRGEGSSIAALRASHDADRMRWADTLRAHVRRQEELLSALAEARREACRADTGLRVGREGSQRASAASQGGANAGRLANCRRGSCCTPFDVDQEDGQEPSAAEAVAGAVVLSDGAAITDFQPGVHGRNASGGEEVMLRAKLSHALKVRPRAPGRISIDSVRTFAALATRRALRHGVRFAFSLPCRLHQLRSDHVAGQGAGGGPCRDPPLASP